MVPLQKHHTGGDAHPVVVFPVVGHHELVAQGVDAGVKGLLDVFGGKGVDVPLAEPLLDLLFRHDAQGFFV